MNYYFLGIGGIGMSALARFFQRVLQRSGVFEALEEKGCKDGDTVNIYDYEFDYVK